MHLSLKHCFLLATVLGAPWDVAARAIERRDVSDHGLLPRFEVPGISIPKPVIPKPVIPGQGNIPGHIPPIKPEPKPAVEKPGQQPCKRADSSDCYFSSDGEGWEQDLGLGIARPSGLDLDKELVFEGGDKKTLHGFTAWKPDAKTVAAHSADFEKNLEEYTKDLYLAAKKKLPSGSINLVAAIYVPEKGIWFSTKPRGDAARLILGDLDSAPALKSRVNNGRKAERDVHAEDGTIYWFEKSQNHQMSPDKAEKWRFPEGTRLAVYGKVSDYRPEGPVGPCNTETKRMGTTTFTRDPTCEAVITMLGITPITHW